MGERRTLDLAGKHLHVTVGEVMNHRRKTDKRRSTGSYMDAFKGPRDDAGGRQDANGAVLKIQVTFDAQDPRRNLEEQKGTNSEACSPGVIVNPNTEPRDKYLCTEDLT